MGARGGSVAATRALIEFLYHRARPFLFSTSHPPAVAAACLAAIEVLESAPEPLAPLWHNTRVLHAALAPHRPRRSLARAGDRRRRAQPRGAGHLPGGVREGRSRAGPHLARCVPQ